LDFRGLRKGGSGATAALSEASDLAELQRRRQWAEAEAAAGDPESAQKLLAGALARIGDPADSAERIATLASWLAGEVSQAGAALPADAAHRMAGAVIEGGHSLTELVELLDRCLARWRRREVRDLAAYFIGSWNRHAQRRRRASQ
jgi:hypothetical protein